jgi:uncharacterized protein (TIGR02680 family)
VSPETVDATRPLQRWTLSRAGIVNVYQYGDEVLHFSGGRLLLRGINGSGKSSAMNMLLPFLLDADTRRIDAAGEQSGVLRGWMLSGRDEPQPQGYLWLEVAKDETYLSFGCGIRANRATDQVTTWWFITTRRPGIDFQLTEDRVPVSRDALRAAIGPDPLYGQEQRTDYRAELRRRIFAGADIEQHLHLLRIVRNPRVGDRLDEELPQYLQDALPQLSEAALDDAAQPLEDLEEHRRNVADLGQTAEALVALRATYCNYARTEMHRLADKTYETVRISRERRRDEEKARDAHRAALERQDLAAVSKRELDGEIGKQQSAIDALKESDAYKSGAQLNDLRNHVESLERNRAAASEALERLRTATGRAAGAIRSARQEVMADREALGRRLSDLASLASGCMLAARPPSVPQIDSSSDGDLRPPPPQRIDTSAVERALSAVSAAARQRVGEVEQVEAALRIVDLAERALRDAERAEGEARTASDKARSVLAHTREEFRSAANAWQSAVAGWIERVRVHHAAHGLAPVQMPAEVGMVVEEIRLEHRLGPMLEVLTAPAIRHHESLRAQHKAALERRHEQVQELEIRAAELAAKQLPDPPMLGWQRRESRCLAELVDFAEHLEPSARAGLEAALEASGLLAAEVHRDGTLRLADGQLVIAAAGADLPAPLSDVLCAEVPPESAHAEMRQAVERALRSISTDLTTQSDTVVTLAGEFRLGTVRGRHIKGEAEHVGVAARRRALQRQRDEIANALEEARAEWDRVAEQLEAAEAALQEAVALRQQSPSDQALHSAFWRQSEAARAVEETDEQLRTRRSELELADQRHSDAAASARASATRLTLPITLEELRGLRSDLGRIAADSREAQGELTHLARSVDRWVERGADWQAARGDEERSGSGLASLLRELMSAQERLTTLDATIGASYQEIVAAIDRHGQELVSAHSSLERIEEELKQSVIDATGAAKDRESAAKASERADAECGQSLDLLARALAVPGFVDAAADVSKDAPDGALPEGRRPETPAGAALPGVRAVLPGSKDAVAAARELVETVRAQVPRPNEPLTSAEGVRQSIRRRRDSLGAGWDAEDRQPDEQLPLHVEVTGPLTQQTPLPAATQIVQSQLATMAGLLSAKQDQALRNLLQGLVAREIAAKLHSAGDLIRRMNERLSAITTSHGIGVKLRWRRRDDLDPTLSQTVELLSKPPDLRTVEEDIWLAEALGRRIDDAHREDSGAPYRELIARVLDYRDWHGMTILLLRPGHNPERLSRRTALSEGEKKIVSYLPLFAAVAASCDGLAAGAPDALRFVLLDDAFAKVSEDNHAKLFGLLVELDLDFIATSERLWGTHDTVPLLAITEVIRDADLETIVLEHSHWDGHRRKAVR